MVNLFGDEATHKLRANPRNVVINTQGLNIANGVQQESVAKDVGDGAGIEVTLPDEE